MDHLISTPGLGPRPMEGYECGNKKATCVFIITMARNYEKRFTGLNRFLEAKQKAEGTGEKKRRPPLHRLTTADDVKQWIPSIQMEIQYLLQQLTPGVKSRSYPDYKIAEFEERLEKLEREHKRFVAKVHTLDPGYKATPWEPRGYTRRRPRSVAMTTSGEPLHSALLEKEVLTMVPSMKCAHSTVPIEETEAYRLTTSNSGYAYPAVQSESGAPVSHLKGHTPASSHLQQHGLHTLSTPASSHLQQHGLHTLSTPASSHLQQHGLHTLSTPASSHLQQHGLHTLSTPASSHLRGCGLGLDYSSSDEEQSVNTY